MPNRRGNLSTLKHYRPKWRSGQTQTIRVPVALTEQIFVYARQLDEGQVLDPGFDCNSLSQVIQKLEIVLDTPRNNFSRDKKKLLTEAIGELKSLVTSDTMQK